MDFKLTPEQEAIQKSAREFARDFVAPIAGKAFREPDPHKAFLMYKPVYEKAAEQGFTFSHVPKEYGGLGLKAVDSVLITEEMSAVDQAFPLGNGFAQSPIMMYGTKAQKEKWLTEPLEAIEKGRKDYICGYLLSEPSGTASYDGPGQFPAGVNITAEYKAGEYILNGRKTWPALVAGWDMKGADQNVFIVRTSRTKGGKEGLSALIVPRGTSGLKFSYIDKYALRTVPTYETVCEDVHVPEENLLGEGMGDFIASKSWGASGAGAGIKAVGSARTALEYAMDWARTYTGGSGKPLIQNQVVGYMLFDIATRIEACRSLCWRTAAYIEEHGAEAGAILMGSMTKVYCSEVCLQAIYDCMRVVGINSVDSKHPLNKIFLDVSINPLEMGGNVGIHRRKGWGVMTDPGYNPLMLMENRDLPYKKEMEGWGTVFG